MSDKKKENKGRFSAAKTRVFISHCWGERRMQHAFAKEICGFLKKEKNLEPIIDEERFSPGISWKVLYRDIVKGGKSVVIFLFSKEFLVSPNCKFELEVAHNSFISKGVPLIAIKIEDVTIPEIMKDDIYVDMTKTFELFLENKVDLESEFQSKVDYLVRGIKDGIKKYENRVHITRVIHPDDHVLQESRDLFLQYPRDYRDDFESVQQWLGECSDQFLKGKYFQELYYVAYYRGKCVGVLYATSYLSSQHNDGYAVICPLVVAKGAATCGDFVVARELLHRLKKDTNTETSNCERYFAELPRMEELEPFDVETCFRGWQSLSDDECLGVIPGLNYLSPDSKEFIKCRGKDYEAEPMHLLTVLGYPCRAMSKKEIIRDILNFIYGVYHAEGYSNPFYLREWVAMVNNLQKEVESSLPKKCRMTFIEPKRIFEYLEDLEND